MKQDTTTYTITNNTLALLPAKTIEFSAIAIEQHQCILIRQTPLEIVQASCIKNWSSYQVRRQIAIQHTGFKQKTPIPINIPEGPVVFPTHSPKNTDCCWIPLSPYVHIIPHLGETTLHIGHGQTITFNLSKHTLQKQLNRAFDVYYKIQSSTRWKNWNYPVYN